MKGLLNFPKDDYIPRELEENLRETNSLFTIVETKEKTSEILARCKKLFNVWQSFTDAEMDKDFPPPKKLTTRYFSRNIEADPEMANKSADELGEPEKYITIRERLLMELQYFKETGQHLDLENVTLCAGSRYAGGSVPRVYWSPTDRKLYVSTCYSNDAGSSLRARAAVPFALEPSDDLGLRMEKLENEFADFKAKLRSV